MSILKQQYNGLLERHRKAETFLENNVGLDDKDLFLDNYRELTNQLGNMLDQIGVYMVFEALEGFYK